jgi:hypothetical protein
VISIRYLANLHRIGAIPQEEIIALQEYAKLKNWEKVKKAILKNNLLLKQNSKRNVSIINEIKARFDHSNPLLPPITNVAQYILKLDSNLVKKQITMVYFLNKDELARILVTNYLIPYIENHFNPELTKDLVLLWLEQEGNAHSELAAWSISVKDRWASNFISALRKFDYLKPHPQKDLQIPRIRLETFAFFFLFHTFAKMPLAELKDLEFWRYFAISSDEWNEILYGLETKHWVKIEQINETVNIEHYYKNFAEWILNGLG